MRELFWSLVAILGAFLVVSVILVGVVGLMYLLEIVWYVLLGMEWII